MVLLRREKSLPQTPQSHAMPNMASPPPGQNLNLQAPPSTSCCAHCSSSSSHLLAADGETKRFSFHSSFIPSRRSGQAPSSFIIDTTTEASTSSFIPSLAKHQFSTLPYSQTLPSTEPTSPQPQPRNSPSYDKFLNARRRSLTKSIASSTATKPVSTAPLHQKSLLTRFNWTLEQAFGGQAPQTPVTQVRVQRAQAKQIQVVKKPDPPKPKSTEQKRLSSSASSIVSFYSRENYDCPDLADDVPLKTTTATHKVLSPAVKPFANRRIPPPKRSAPNPTPEPTLSTVQEEDCCPLQEAPEEVEGQTEDDMGLVRSLTQRLSRSDYNASSIFKAPPPRSRPEISLPHLIHTTNQFINDAASIRPTSTNSNVSTTPSTPTSDAPSLTNTSSRSSSEGTRSECTPSKERFGVAPNHLTQYFASQEKSSTTITVIPALPSDSVNDFATVAPTLPTRAPSHSKREHVRLARERVVRSSAVSVSSTGSPRSARSSITPEEVAEPFSAELAQLDEIAEDVKATEDFDSMLLESVDEGCEYDFRRCSTNSYTRMLVDLEAARWSD